MASLPSTPSDSVSISSSRLRAALPVSCLFIRTLLSFSKTHPAACLTGLLSIPSRPISSSRKARSSWISRTSPVITAPNGVP
jgi:hypothetical protein